MITAKSALFYWSPGKMYSGQEANYDEQKAIYLVAKLAQRAICKRHLCDFCTFLTPLSDPVIFINHLTTAVLAQKFVQKNSVSGHLQENSFKIK